MRFIYLLSCIGLGLIILLPTVLAVISIPSSEEFSELWLLGSNHMIGSGVLNISRNKPETVYLGVGNHMGESKYYVVYAKFRNQLELLPDVLSGLPSPLEPVFEYRVLLRNNETLEKTIGFSFEDVSFEPDSIRISKLIINGQTVIVDKIVPWDVENNGFYCQLFFELWIYDVGSSSFQFHNRSVWFWLNVVND